MKLLFDQNLAPRLARALQDLFPGSFHVREIGLERSQDRDIWNYAADHEFAVVSKDSDFRQMSFLYGAPPKVIWISQGNCSTRAIEQILRSQHDKIEEFLNEREAAFLLIG